MLNKVLAGALALATAAMPVAAQADDPNDPQMRDPRARAKDKAIIRQLNLNQLAYVRKRDADYARQWKAWRDYKENVRRGGDYDYADALARHERDMAEWRRAVRLCESGRNEYCADR